MSLLKLENINKYYKLNSKDKFHALKNINIEFNKGELVAIIGESGSGKSTLMNLIGGLDSSFEGELTVCDKNINSFSQIQLDEYRKHTIGFIFQSCNLIEHLSVLDNVTIALTLSNVDKKERIERAKKALAEVGLKDHVNKRPNQLSGGEKQRVSIARALINNPEIILADEPTGSLDSNTTKQILNIIKKISQSGHLVIMVTHSKSVASSCDRIIEISDGCIINDTKIHESKYINNFEEDNSNTINIDEYPNQNLSFISSIRLALNNINKKLNRNILVVFGVSISIMSIVIMLSLGNGLKIYFQDIINNFVNPLIVEVNMPISKKSSNPTGVMKTVMGQSGYFKSKNIDELSKIKNVKDIEKGFNLINMPGINFLTYGDKESDVIMIKSISSLLSEDNIAKGRFPQNGSILVNKAIEKSLGKGIIGKTVTLSIFKDGEFLEREFIVSGIYKSSSDDNRSDAVETIYVNFDDIESMYNDYDLKLPITSIYLIAENKEDANSIKSQIKSLGYRGSTEETLGEQMLIMSDVLTMVLAGIAVVSLFVASIMILVVLYISVIERTKEIGLLRSIGARSKDIKRIFVSEAFLIGISGGIIGVVSAYIISIFVNMYSLREFQVAVMKITFYHSLTGLLLSTIVSMICGRFPAKKAANLDPVVALRTE